MCGGWRGLWLSVALHAAWAGSGVAQAPADDDATRAAQREHDAAVHAFAQGEYRAAVAHFSAADKLRPNPAFAFNMAKAYEAAGDDSHALASYRDYLRRAENAADQAAVTERIQALAGRLAQRGVQQITVRSTPTGAAAFLDSEPIGVTPVTLDVRPGKHTLQLRLAGHESAETAVEIARDNPLEVSFALVPHEQAASNWSKMEEPAEVLPSAPTPQAEVVVSSYSTKGPHTRAGSVLRTVGFVALGASVAAFGSALTFEILRSDAADAAKREREQVKVAEQLETAHTRQTVARVLAGTGGALAVLGGVMLLAGTLSGQSGQERKPKQGLALACQPSKCVATLSGAF